MMNATKSILYKYTINQYKEHIISRRTIEKIIKILEIDIDQLIFHVTVA